MTIEDRVRRVLADAVADEPPPRGAALQVALRRRRRRPVLAGAVALVLVLASAIGLVVIRGQAGPGPVTPAPTTATPTTATTVASTAGWKTFTDTDHNLRLRYPPTWVVRRRNAEGTVTLSPPEHARKALASLPPFAVTVTAGAGYYAGEVPEPGMTRGRLPGGRTYLLFESDPAQMGEWPGGPTPAPSIANRPRTGTYSVDWGRDCKGIRPYRCGPHGLLVTINAGSTALWDRFLAAAEAIVGAAEPVTPTRPSRGDRTLPPCRPDQWRVIWNGDQGSAGSQRFFLSGGIQHVKGPRCHLRADMELLIQRAGRRLPMPGNPATKLVEGDLPEDGIVKESGSWVMRGGPLFWSWYWDEWCNKGLEGPTELRLTAANGQRLMIGGPRRIDAPGTTLPGRSGCQDRGRPSVLAGWP